MLLVQALQVAVFRQIAREADEVTSALIFTAEPDLRSGAEFSEGGL
ncbi:hypothetical protein [Smaragdicoccus niigatensis]|nr:hypothetical protein [Smaragdicoccus niigatensis]